MAVIVSRVDSKLGGGRAKMSQPPPASTDGMPMSSALYDHTSILATIELKWNLPALTRRDAAASPLTDFLELGQPPPFLTPPSLQPPTIWPFTGKR